MRRARNQRIEAAATTASRLQWQVARRGDGDVAKAIAMGEELDGVYQLDYVGLFTGFLAYLRLIGLWAAMVALNKEAKQNWYLEHAPMRTRHAMSNHVFMVLTMIATTRAYRAYQERLETDPEEKKPAADPLGFRRWRRQVLNENADKVIVFVGDMFAILPLVDFCMLVSTTTVRIRGAPPRTTVLAHYGVMSTLGA